MVKNKFGGKNAKKLASKNSNQITRTLLFKENNQDYGKITKIFGNCRFEVTTCKNIKLLGIARGKMRKKIWIRLNNYILYTIRDFEEDKVDIIHTYNDDEVKQLIKYNEIIEIKENNEELNNNEVEIVFEDI